MYFPEEKISEIKNSADIVEVISEYVNLKQAGKNFLGLCPFHSEKLPSFTVNPEKQIFHCFGCKEGGNVFSFLMKQNSVSFPEAVKMLAEKKGIPLPVSGMTQKQKKHIKEKEQIFNANKEAAKYFHYSLLNSNQGETALYYLKKRKTPGHIIKKFCIGYSLNEWNGLYNALIKKFPPLILEKAGLIIAKNGRYYDRFRNRIIFPIIDTGKKVIGFGGRALDDSMPKYLNSPETSIYNKRKSLYGFSLSKDKMRIEKTAYIVEGYFDLLTLFSFGIENTVATLGTSLTSDHIRMLKGFADKITLLYDSDEAGVKAAARSVNLFMKEGVTAFVMILPEGYDPDTFLLKFGSEAFHKLSKQSLSLIHFLIETAIKKYGLSIEGKLKIIKDMSNPLSAVEDNLARSLYIKKMAEKIEVEERYIIEKLRKNFGNIEKNRDDIPLIEPQIKGKMFKIEEKIITMMLQFPKIINEIQKKDILARFEDEELKSIGYEILKNKKDETDNISHLISIDNKKTDKIISSLAVKEEVWDIKSCMNLIRQFEISYDKIDNRLNKMIKAAENENNIELLSELLKKKIGLAAR